MYYEYCNYNTIDHLNNKEQIDLVFKLIDQGLDGFCTDIYQIREIAKYIPEGFVLSGAVDYPLGKSDTKVRQHQAINTLRSGANAIDLVCHRQYLMNNDWSHLKQDISSIKEICKNYNATLRVMINWEDEYDGAVVVNIARLLYSYGMDIFIPSLGYYHDDFVDNLVISHITQAETKIYTICNGYMYVPKHKEQFLKAEIFGLRLYHTNYKMVYI